MGEQFIVNDAAQDMSDGNVHFLNPGRFGVLYNQRVIAKFLAPSSIPSQEPYGGDAHRLCLLQGMLYVGRVAAGRKAYQNITFRSQGCCLPFEDAVEAIIIADCGQDGSVGCHGDGGQAFPFGHETSDEFGGDMLGIGCTAAVTAKQDFVPLSKGLYYQIADSFNVGKHLPVVQDIFFEPDTFLDGLGDIILHNFLISLVQRYDISEMKLAFDEIFKLSLLSPFQSAEESEEYAFFNIESSLLGI